MRFGLFIVGLIALASPAQAEPRSAYVTMVLQAFATKVECPGTDVAIRIWCRRLMKRPVGGTTEKVRKAIAYMHTGGKMGERGDAELMTEVALATRSTDLDQRRLGLTTWCETQKTRLAVSFARKTSSQH